MKAEGYGGRSGSGDTTYRDIRVLDGLLGVGIKMIDHYPRIVGIVKDELARQCAAHGISKEEAGYLVTGGFAPVMNEQGQATGLNPCVFVTISLRSSLAPFKPVAGGLPAFGILPDDDLFRAIVKRLVSEVDQTRRDEMNPPPQQAPPKTIRGQVER